MTAKNKDFGQVIMSPLDSHDYKVVELASNKLKGLLISTCDHDLDLGSPKELKLNKANAVFNKIREFNKSQINLETRTGSPSSKLNDCRAIPFCKATEKRKEVTCDKREMSKQAKKAKCHRGTRVKYNDMQDARNNLCFVILNIKAGMLSDPAWVQGMAHYCEHAIFLGSKNYPDTETLQKFVEGNGGFANARTDPESTTYYFYIDVKHVNKALDIFIDMLVNPNFDKCDVLREVDVINSEFEIKRLSEDHRYLALLQSCVVEGHPAKSFGMGTEESLTRCKNNLDTLKQWKSHYYTADNMVLTIQGPFPVDRLEKLFIKYGSLLPCKDNQIEFENRVEQYIGQPTFENDQWNRFYYVVPVSDTKVMSISWHLDPKFGKDYDTKPFHYFQYIFSKKGEGSLDFYLQQRGWILSLCFTCPEFGFMYTNYHSIFGINLELTEKGFAERINVLRDVFSFIKFVQTEKASEFVFDEIRQMHADIFHYRSDKNLVDPTVGYFFNTDNCMDCLRELSETMNIAEPPEEVLVLRFLEKKFNAELLDEFARSLKPSNALVMLYSKSFEKDAKEQEQWCKTKYYAEPFCEELRKELEEIPPLDNFKHIKNPFIQASMCMPDNNCQKIENQSGIQIYKSPKGLVVYGNEDCETKGCLPSAQYIISMYSPVFEDLSDIRVIPCMDVFKRMLIVLLDTRLGQALNALISYDVINSPSVLSMELLGPSPKLPELASIMLNTFDQFEKLIADSPSVFENIKQSVVQQFFNIMNESESCGETLKQYILRHRGFFLSDYNKYLNSCRIDDFLQFVQDFKRCLYISGDLDGCVLREHAQIVANAIDKMEYRPYARKLPYNVVNRCIKLPLGEKCLIVSSKAGENHTSFVLNYYQIGKLTDEQDMMLEIIGICIQDSLFEELRTKSQLGYALDSEVEDTLGIGGVSIFVVGQADKHSCGYIDEEIDNFLQNLYNKILRQQKNFNVHVVPFLRRKEKQTLKLKDMQKFYQDYFLSDGQFFRKLSIQIQGQKKSSKSQPLCARRLEQKEKKFSSGRKIDRRNESGISPFSQYLQLKLKNVDEENGYFISDVQKFKNGQQYFGNSQVAEEFESDVDD